MNETPNSPMPDVAPVPRDAGSSLMSEILPINSRKTRFWKSKVLAPALATVATTMLLFSADQSSLEGFWNYAFILGAFILFILFYGIYLYGGSRKPLWVFAFPYLLTLFFFMPPMGFVFFNGLATLFRDILPGGEVPLDAPFTQHFVISFFGAGLCEELFKALAIFVLIWLGHLANSRMDRPLGRFLDKIAVRTPLDGLLAGAASGAAFICFETFGQYYNNAFNSAFDQTANAYAGVATALALAIPRSLQGLVGHMAWNGIFGYFIALSLRRRNLSFVLILAGWLIAAAMHGFWNAGAVSLGGWALWVSGMTTLVFFLATLLKARQLEPRNSASVYDGSIAVGAAASGMAPLNRASHPPIQAAAPQSSVVAVAMPAPAAPPSEPQAQMVLIAGAHIFHLAPGKVISGAGLVDIEKLGPGFLGEVSLHPADPSIVGLKNLGSRPWTLFSSKGVSQVVEPGRSARLEPGNRIIHGDLALTVSIPS